MRVLPLLPSSTDPAPWSAQREVELAWDGALHPQWVAFARAGGVHGIHISSGTSLDAIQGILRETLPLGFDFLVLPASKPVGRKEAFAFLGMVEALLEALAPKGIKLAIKPREGAETELATLLKASRGEAVGFCWHGSVRELGAVEDRLFCAMGNGHEDLEPLQDLGYRWNFAVSSQSLDHFLALKKTIEARYPSVLFPKELPTHVMGRPVVPDAEVRFARHEQGGDRS